MVDEGFLRRYRELLDAEDAAFDELEHAIEDGDRAHFEADLDAVEAHRDPPARVPRSARARAATRRHLTRTRRPVTAAARRPGRRTRARG